MTLAEVAQLATARSEVREEYFHGVGPIQYEGPESKNPYAFKEYNPEEVIGGMTMKDALRFAGVYWHTMKGTGNDPFGPGTAKRAWLKGDSSTNEGRMQIAKQTMDAMFEFLVKMGIPFWTFHDRDIAPEAYIGDKEDNGIDVEQTEKNLYEMVEYAKAKQKETGVKLLWGTANVFSNPRFMSGAGSNPNFDVLAHAGTQIRAAMKATAMLGGLNYVFWGGREGYSTLHNTFMGLEKKHIAQLLKMAVAYRDELEKEFGYKIQLLIEPKAHEPTSHQYDFDAATTLGILGRPDGRDQYYRDGY